MTAYTCFQSSCRFEQPIVPLRARVRVVRRRRWAIPESRPRRQRSEASESGGQAEVGVTVRASAVAGGGSRAAARWAGVKVQPPPGTDGRPAASVGWWQRWRRPRQLGGSTGLRLRARRLGKASSRAALRTVSGRPRSCRPRLTAPGPQPSVASTSSCNKHDLVSQYATRVENVLHNKYALGQ